MSELGWLALCAFAAAPVMMDRKKGSAPSAPTPPLPITPVTHWILHSEEKHRLNQTKVGGVLTSVRIYLVRGMEESKRSMSAGLRGNWCQNWWILIKGEFGSEADKEPFFLWLKGSQRLFWTLSPSVSYSRFEASLSSKDVNKDGRCRSHPLQEIKTKYLGHKCWWHHLEPVWAAVVRRLRMKYPPKQGSAVNRNVPAPFSDCIKATLFLRIHNVCNLYQHVSLSVNSSDSLMDRPWWQLCCFTSCITHTGSTTSFPHNNCFLTASLSFGQLLISVWIRRVEACGGGEERQERLPWTLVPSVLWKYFPHLGNLGLFLNSLAGHGLLLGLDHQTQNPWRPFFISDSLFNKDLRQKWRFYMLGC